MPVLLNPAGQTLDSITNLIYLPNKTTPLILAKKQRIVLPSGQIVFDYLYTLDDGRYTIPVYYSSQLMPKAVAYSAGVIKYFLSLKGTGEVVIDSPSDGTVVYSPSVDISGHLTYYASSAIIYYHPAGTLPRDKIEIPVTLDTATGRYVFSTVNTPISLVVGDNKIEVVADNENVDATPARITVLYGGGHRSLDTDDDDDDDEG